MLKLALHWQILIAMVAGAAVGMTLNLWFSEVGTPQQPIEIDLPRFVLHVYDSTNRSEVTLVDKQTGESQQHWIDPQKASRAKAEQDADVLVHSSMAEFAASAPLAYQLYREHGRSTASWLGEIAQTIGNLFLRLLKMVSVPLIVTSLITGVTGLGNAEEFGKLFTRTVLYYVSTSLLAIVIGLCMVNLVRPGVGAELIGGEPDKEVLSAENHKSLGTVLYEQLEALIPTNPFQALANGDFLSIISFSIAFGIFTLLVRGEAAEQIAKFFWASFAVMMVMTMAIIHLAPIGVFFLMLFATATQGIEVFQSLSWYMLTVFMALMFHAAIALPLIVRFVARRSPWEFAQAMSPALLTAFSSASSNATLPLTMTCVEQRAGISNKISSFVLPLGATINMDGTALYEAVAVLFIAQMSGIELSLAQQIIVALTALLASIGAAGIPHAGLVMMVIILQAVGLPTESQGLIIAVDRVLDMARTSVNVWSDCCGTAVVARFEPVSIAEPDTPYQSETTA